MSETSILTGYLTRQQLAVELGVTERTLWRWEAAGTAPRRTLLGRRIVYRREAVEKWLRDREQDDPRAAVPGKARMSPRRPNLRPPLARHAIGRRNASKTTA
jgi:predicted DNA-binding transcriptional regulator AlpA